MAFIVVWSLSGRSFLARHSKRVGGGYEYFLVGNAADVVTRTRAGLVLEGGGKDIEESFHWMIDRSGGGDFLVLRTTGTDAYNNEIFDMTTPSGLRADSAATLIVTSRAGAFDPFVARTIRSAEALWIAGGDQALHHTRWRETPVADAIQDLLARGVPIGGTSSGLAVMGEYSYTSEGDGPDQPHLTSTAALRYPSDPRITIRGGFLHLPFLDGVILEPHFIQESRYGRMAVFLTRIAAEGRVREPRGLGIDRNTALLVEPDGSARLVIRPDHTQGKAVLFRLVNPSTSDHSLAAPFIDALEFGLGSRIDLLHWNGSGGSKLRFSIDGSLLNSAARTN